jgi:hypothetical protein
MEDLDGNTGRRSSNVARNTIRDYNKSLRRAVTYNFNSPSHFGFRVFDVGVIFFCPPGNVITINGLTRPELCCLGRFEIDNAGTD